MNWASKLLYWYQENKRSLPWRETTNPYLIWVSEIILQQTRISQGKAYYLNFIDKFPTLQALAFASEEEVLMQWEGLGYYSRARNMHFTAQYLVNEREGKFPTSFKELLQLKGIGDYTASAISSICSGEKQAVVDGNVYRFLSRCFGIYEPINTQKSLRVFKLKAMELMKDSAPSNFNQGLMELGATICTPRKPECPSCPFQNECVAKAEHKIENLPVKQQKAKVRKRYFTYIIPLTPENKTIVKLREQKDIWLKLNEFPLIEEKKLLSQKEILLHKNFLHLLNNQKRFVLFKKNTEIIKHKLSHFDLYINFWELQIKKLPQNVIPLKLLKELPKPVIVKKFLEENYF